jgi:hypothetical protein
LPDIEDVRADASTGRAQRTCVGDIPQREFAANQGARLARLNQARQTDREPGRWG